MRAQIQGLWALYVVLWLAVLAGVWLTVVNWR